MKPWLQTLPQWLAHGQDCVLVTVVHVAGSTPREAGASMLVRLADAPMQQTVDTIGGGHLEWEACQIAQDMLLHPQGESIRLERFNLGARLGQCCGGLVLVLFERIAASSTFEWQQRLQVMQGSYCLTRTIQSTDLYSSWSLAAEAKTEKASFSGDSRLESHQMWSYSQQISSHQFDVYIFGAGHVGQALVNLLLPLQARVRLIDERDDVFPDISHPNLQCISTDTPEADIAAAPSHSYFLIMTHNHALDLQLCHAVFKRHDFAYFGMIGSKSKRAVFERRLLDRGVLFERLPQLICPIGVAGISSKEPAAIAVGVVAQLLQVWSAKGQVQAVMLEGQSLVDASSAIHQSH
jgi:xanthine dehydrogenase accessory factor